MKWHTDFVAESAKRRIEEENAFEHLSGEAPRILELENACVVPRSRASAGGMFADGRRIPDSAFGEAIPVGDEPPNVFSDVPFEDEEVVYIGMLLPAWGHCLTDNLRHLWFLVDDRYGSLKNCTMVYTAWNRDPLPENFFKILDHLGVARSRLRKIGNPVRFRKVHFPTPCFRGETTAGRHFRTYTREYGRLIEKVGAGIPPHAGADSVYLTRNGLQPYRDCGEGLVEDAFLRAGYAVVRPDSLSLEDQIALLKGCRRLAGTDGSVLHNSVFLSRGASLAIVRKADYFNSYQGALNQLRDLDVTYIDAHKSVMNSAERPYEGPFFMYVSGHLAKFAGIRKGPFPVFLFVRYVIVSFVRAVARKWLRLPRGRGR